MECVVRNGGYHQCVAAAMLDMSQFERETETSKLRPLDEGDVAGDEATPLARDDAAGPELFVIGGGGDDAKGECIPPWGQCGGFFFEPFLRGPERRPCCPRPGDAAGPIPRSALKCC